MPKCDGLLQLNHKVRSKVMQSFTCTNLASGSSGRKLIVWINLKSWLIVFLLYGKLTTRLARCIIRIHKNVRVDAMQMSLNFESYILHAVLTITLSS